MPRIQVKVGEIIKITQGGGGHNYTVGKIYRVISATPGNISASSVENPTWVGNNLPTDCCVVVSDRKELAKQYSLVYTEKLITFNESLALLLQLKEKIGLLKECATEEDELKYVVGKALSSTPDDKKLMGMLKTIMENV